MSEEKKSPDTSPRETLLIEIGNKLVQARESRGETIDIPARTLKLSKLNLQALETGNWQNLPDEVYALGFLRQYSLYLQVDISHELELLKNDQYQLTKPLTFPDPPVAPSRRWAWIAGAAFIALFVLFNIFNSQAPESETVELLPETADIETGSPPDDSASSPSLSDSAEQPEAAAEEEVVEKKVPAVVEERVEKTVETLTPASIETHTYRFEAVDGDVWIQIFLPDELGQKTAKPHREALLKQGYHANVRSSSEFLWVTCGNAHGLRIKVDGKVMAETGSLGGGRKILRDHRFSIAE